MDWFTGVIVFALIWWTALFCVLPVGTRPLAEGDAEAGGFRGVPEKPMLGRKLVGTTVLAAVVWLGVQALISSGVVSFRDGFWAYDGAASSSPLPGLTPSRAQN